MRLCHVPLDLQCIYGYTDERSENEDGEGGNEVSGGGGERVEMTWSLVCR